MTVFKNHSKSADRVFSECGQRNDGACMDCPAQQLRTRSCRKRQETTKRHTIPPPKNGSTSKPVNIFLQPNLNKR